VFVLGGGGNLGATQVGMLQALLERGVRIPVRAEPHISLEEVEKEK